MKTIAIYLSLFSLGMVTGYLLHPSDGGISTTTVIETPLVVEEDTPARHEVSPSPHQTITFEKTGPNAVVDRLPEGCHEFIDTTVERLIAREGDRDELSLPEECQEQSDIILASIQNALIAHTDTRLSPNREEPATNKAQARDNKRTKVTLSPEQQAIHDEWQAGQKTHISGVLESIAPEQLAKRMSRRIGKRSPFLNDVEYKVDDYEDEAWAYQQEQLIYAIISGHPNSAEFTLSSLSCHQMMCEIIGISTTVSGWHRIFQTIRQEAPGYKGFARNQGRGAAIRYTDPELDQSYMYTVLQFEAESMEQDVEG